MLDHPVTRLIRERIARGSRPGERDDGARLALVAEGGGMRGIVAGGMATALEELGAVDAFDDVYGTSAGALGGAFLLAGQAALGTALYFDDLTTSAFISLRRAVTRGRLLSLEFLLDELMSARKPFYWEAVVRHPVRLHPIAAELDTRRVVDLHGEVRDVDGLREALRASARIPGVAGPPVEIGGRGLSDGSLLAPIPFGPALADGATHMLVLRTRPFGSVYRPPPPLVRRYLARRLVRLHPELPALHRDRSGAYAADLARLEELERGDGPPSVLVVAPPAGTAEVKPLERDRARLVTGAQHGAEAVMRALSDERRYFVVALRSYAYSEPARSEVATGA